MPQFGQRSEAALATCHPDLVRVARRAIKVYDFTVTEGHRTEERQNALYNKRPRVTTVRWPNSRHNAMPSNAMDLAPYPIDFHDLERFYVLAGVILACAAEEGVKLRWGGDFNQNGDLHDQAFIDLPHFELVDP